MFSKFREYGDFLIYESKFGLKVVLRDMLDLIKLIHQGKYLETLLEISQKHEVKFTFFFSAKNLDGKINLVDQVIEEGHEIASHGYNHLLLDRLDEEQLMKEFSLARDKFQEYGIKIYGFRPPFKHVDNLRGIAKKFGISYISSQPKGKKFFYENGVMQIPIVGLSDWEAFNVNNLSSKEVLSKWSKKHENKTFLFHPRIIGESENIPIFKKILRMRKYIPLKEMLKKDGIGISFDVY